MDSCNFAITRGHQFIHLFGKQTHEHTKNS